MQTMTLFSNFFNLKHIKGKSLLIIKWNKSTLEAQYSDFVLWNKIIFKEIMKLKPSKILIDAYNYAFPVYTEIKKWNGFRYLNQEMKSINKIAHLVPFNYRIYENLDNLKTNCGECRYFYYKGNALDWLTLN